MNVNVRMARNQQQSFDWEKMQIEDHNGLIRIEANLNNLSADVKILGDGMNAKMIDHESRIRRVEDLLARIDLLNSRKDIDDLKNQVRDFTTSAMVYRTIAGIVGAAVFFLLTQVPNILRGLGFIK